MVSIVIQHYNTNTVKLLLGLQYNKPTPLPYQFLKIKNSLQLKTSLRSSQTVNFIEFRDGVQRQAGSIFFEF